MMHFLHSVKFSLNFVNKGSVWMCRRIGNGEGSNRLVVSSFNTTVREKWDFITAICLERKPIVTKGPNVIEKKYEQMLNSIEFENSMKSDHEIRYEEDLKRREVGLTAEDLDQATQQTAQDFEDACQEELSKFNFAPRITEADDTGNLKSLERKLDKYLTLLVYQKVGKKHHWVLPQALRNEGETLRQTAHRVVKEMCGSNLNVQFRGNAPWGFCKYKYLKESRNNTEDSIGAKVFFMKAQYITRKVEIKKDEISNYCWLTREELEQKLPNKYGDSIRKFLVDENEGTK